MDSNQVFYCMWVPSRGSIPTPAGSGANGKSTTDTSRSTAQSDMTSTHGNHTPRHIESCGDFKYVFDKEEEWEFLMTQLLKLDYSPYPQCTRDRLERGDIFFTACVADQRTTTTTTTPAAAADDDDGDYDEEKSATSTSTTSIEAKTTTTTTQCDAPRLDSLRIVGVVGVSWTSLRFQYIEGYFQVVLVDPEYRGRGIASLLVRVATSGKHESPVKHVSSNGGDAFNAGTQFTTYIANSIKSAYATYNNGRRWCHSQEPCILRWRLHTMAPSSSSSLITSASAESVASEKSSLDLQMNGVKRMYASLGFEERKTLHRYYDGGEDAIEMIHYVASPGGIQGRAQGNNNNNNNNNNVPLHSKRSREL